MDSYYAEQTKKRREQSNQVNAEAAEVESDFRTLLRAMVELRKQKNEIPIIERRIEELHQQLSEL